MFRRQDRIAIYCSMILRHTSYDIQYTKNYSYARRFYDQSSSITYIHMNAASSDRNSLMSDLALYSLQ